MLKKIGLVMVGAGILVSVQSQAGKSDSKSADVKAKVVKSINLTKDRDLDFGDAFTGDSAKTVAPATAESAKFTVTGSTNKSFSVAFADTSITLTPGGGPSGGPNEELVVDNFSHNAPSTIIGGSVEFFVGAQLSAIANDQVEGDYLSTINVTVAYP